MRKTYAAFSFFAMLIVLIISSPSSVTQERFDPISHARSKWQDFLANQLPKESSLEKIESVMKKTGYRDKGRTHQGGTGIWIQYYLIDDFHQVRFDMNRFNNSTECAFIEKASKWLKWPDGELLVNLPPQ